MKDKLPSYEFKVGEECWCVACRVFTFINKYTDKVSHYGLDCGHTYSQTHRPLTLAEAKLLGLEPPRKTKTVTMWQAVFKSELTGDLSVLGALYLSEEQAKCILGKQFIKLVNPIEVEVDE